MKYLPHTVTSLANKFNYNIQCLDLRQVISSQQCAGVFLLLFIKYKMNPGRFYPSAHGADSTRGGSLRNAAWERSAPETSPKKTTWSASTGRIVTGGPDSGCRETCGRKSSRQNLKRQKQFVSADYWGWSWSVMISRGFVNLCHSRSETDGLFWLIKLAGLRLLYSALYQRGQTLSSHHSLLTNAWWEQRVTFSLFTLFTYSWFSDYSLAVETGVISLLLNVF